MSPIIVRTAQDLIPLTPILCGFHPSESVVMIAVGADGRAAAAVLDVPRTLREWSAARTSLGRSTAQLMHQISIDTLGVVVFSADLHNAEQFLTFLGDNGVGLPIFARVAAGPSEWVEVTDADTHERQPYLGTSAIEVEAVLAGVPLAVPTADELSTRVAPIPTPEAAQQFATRVAAVENPMSPALVRVWFDQWTLDGYPTLTDDQAADLAAAVQTHTGRDTAMIMMSRSDAEQHSHLWRDISARTAGTVAQPVLALSAMATWLNGYGRQARLINNRAKEECSGQPYGMQSILDELLDSGLGPDLWAGLRDSVRDGLDDETR